MKVKCYVFRSYQQRYRVFLLYLEKKLQEKGLVDAFEYKVPENPRKSIFKAKQTTKNTSLMFLDLKVLTER